MFCPNCGKEIKDNVKFCPMCGAATGKKPAGDHTKGGAFLGANQKISVKIPTAKNPKAKLPTAQSASRSLPFKNPKKLALPLAAVLLVLVLISGISFMMKPRLKDAKAKEMVAQYFETHEEYEESGDQYRECFQYMVNDLTRQLSSKLSSLISGFVDTSRVDINAMSQEIGTALSDYFSNSSNQIALGEAVISEAKYEVGSVVKKDGVVSVEVTVTGLDIGEVNRQLISDSVSVQGLVSIAIKFAGGGFLSSAIDVAEGDISFLLDGFIKKAKSVNEKSTYIGTIEFEYNKEAKEWEISHADSKLLDAYFGIY